MGARQKLNSIHLWGSVAVAGFIGTLAESWAVFLIVAALLLAGSLYDGSIRPRGGRQR